MCLLGGFIMRFRRFLSYIIIVLTVCFTVGFNTQRLLDSRTNTMEFTKGTQLVFELSKRDNTKYESSDYPNTYGTSFSDLNEIDIKSKVMERLDSAGVRNAEVTLVNGTSDNQGYQLKVNFSPLSSTELSNVKEILLMTGSLTIGVTGDDYLFTQDKNQLFASTVAEVVYDDTTPYPVINIGNTDDYDTLVDEAKKAYESHKDDSDTDTSSSDTTTSSVLRPSNPKKADDDDDDDSSDEDTTGQGTVYLWYNKTVDDTFDLAFGKNSKYKVTSVADKVLATLYTSDYDSDTKQWKIKTDKDGNSFNVSTARAFVTMLNSSDYGFDIKYLYSNSINIPFGKNASSLAVNVVMIALAIISVILIMCYGLAGFAGSLSLFTVNFFSLFLFNTLGFEFSIAAIVGIAVVSALSIFMSVNYFTRVKLELKKKRRIDKSNKEGFKKSVLLSLDVMIITFVGSLFSFLIANGMFKTFFGMVLVGSIISFVITVFLNYGLMYFLTKGVAKSKCPFFGFSFLNKATEKVSDNEKLKNVDLATCTVKKKSFISMITAAVIPVLLFVIAIPTVYSTTNGERVFNNQGDYSDSYVLNISYKMDTNKYEALETDKAYLQYIKDIGLNSKFGNYFALEYGEEKPEDYKDKDYPIFYYSSSDCYTYLQSYTDSENKTFYIKYFSLKVSTPLADMVTQDNNTVIDVIERSMKGELIESDEVSICPGLNEYFVNNAISDFSVRCLVETPMVITYYTSNLILLVFLFSLFACIYTLFRYGVNIFLGQLTFSTLSALFMISMLAITRIPFNAYTSFALLAAIIITNVASVIFLAKNKELIKEKGLKGKATSEDKAKCINIVFKEALPSVISIILTSLAIVVSTICINGALTGAASIFAVITLPLVFYAMLFLLPYYYILTTHISFRRVKDFFLNFKEKHQKNKKEKEEKLLSDINYVDDDTNHETIIVGMNEFKF